MLKVLNETTTETSLVDAVELSAKIEKLILK
jgi:hypothetical protein